MLVDADPEEVRNKMAARTQQEREQDQIEVRRVNNLTPEERREETRQQKSLYDRLRRLDRLEEKEQGIGISSIERELNQTEKKETVNSFRLAYLSEAPVNWCPALGTVLANEEVTVDGKSERGNHPVYRRPLKQWMMRITAYADRLLEDLENLEWTEAIKSMQRNWIGKS